LVKSLGKTFARNGFDLQQVIKSWQNLVKVEKNFCQDNYLVYNMLQGFLWNWQNFWQFSQPLYIYIHIMLYTF